MADRTRKKHQRKWKWYAKNVQRSTTLTERYNRSFYRIFVVAPRETIFDPNNEKHRPPPLFGISLCKEKRRKKKKRKRTKKGRKQERMKVRDPQSAPHVNCFFFFFFYTFHSFIDLWFIFSLRKFSERNFNETRRLKKKKTILYNKKKSEKIRRLSSVETEKRKKKKERRKKRKRIQFFDFVARP